MMISVAAVEFIEAALWHDDSLTHITFASASAGAAAEPFSCSRYNQRLTLIIWICILPWQPLFLLSPCRHVEPLEYNHSRFHLPELLAVLFGLAMVIHYLWTQSELVPYFLKRRSVEESNYHSYHHLHTCSFIGLHGHLHWTVATADTYMSPNGFTYHLLWIAGWFARPRALFACAITLVQVVFAFHMLWLGPSFEIGSIWCWTGGLFHLYLLLQPYVCLSRIHRQVAKHEE